MHRLPAAPAPRRALFGSRLKLEPFFEPAIWFIGRNDKILVDSLGMQLLLGLHSLIENANIGNDKTIATKSLEYLKSCL